MIKNDEFSYEYDTDGEITKVIIPEGVTHIGNAAFEWCENLASVIIPQGVTEIGNGAFAE